MFARAAVPSATARCDGIRNPTLVVDGIELGLTELGKMLSTYEGWEFELKIIDSLE
jgi:hypothetical protein